MRREVFSLWRWLCVAAIVLTALAVLSGEWIVLVAALACAVSGAVFCKSETGRWPSAFLARWWASVSMWAVRLFREWRGRWLAASDDAPGYWETPARDETHAGYRADYERLVTKHPLKRADFFQIAELADGLQAYGDRPLAKPPRLRALAAFGAGGLVSAGVSRWVAIGAGALFLTLLATCGLLWGRGESLKAQRDAACSAAELEGRSTRQPCRDLATASDRIFDLEGRLHAEAIARANAVARAQLEAEATRALNDRAEARRRASASRLRRAHADDVEAARTARAPDWDQRLRDLATPAAMDEPAAGEPGPGDGAAGGMPAGSAAEASVSGSPAGDVAEPSDRPIGRER